MTYKIVLFGLTGFGSKLLLDLIDLKHEIVYVFTRKEDVPYPYFSIRSVNDIAEQHGIPFSFSLPETIDADADLVLCSTYDRILPERILSTPKLGSFNFHPSLLPSYKGLTPTKQTLLHGESQTGLSLHKINNAFDTSHIITQRPLEIDEFFDDGLLRQRLSDLQYPMLLDLFEFLDSPEGYPKTLSGLPESGYFEPFHELNIQLTEKISVLQLSRQLRASSPFPGLRLKYKDKYYELKKFLEFSPGKYDFNFKESGYISIYGNDGVLHCVGHCF